MSSVTELERVTIVTPLGVRFRDAATRSVVSEALSVFVYPASECERRTRGVPNTEGIFVFHNLPGLAEVERGKGDAEFWAHHAADVDFVLEVKDASGRFLPYQISISLPHRGLLGRSRTSPLEYLFEQQSGDDASLPLYSSVSRPLPDGMGAFRAELVDAMTLGPAAWALVAAKAGEQRQVFGVADAKGRVMVPLLYPKPVITLGSPGSMNTPVHQQTWAVDVTIRYASRDPQPDVPDLNDILGQPVAGVWMEDTSPPREWSRGTLRYGRDVAAENEDEVPPRIRRLLITPAGSPP